MSDIIFIGSAAAVAFFLLQQSPSEQAGVVGSTDETVDAQGTVIPQNTGEQTVLDTNVLKNLRSHFSTDQEFRNDPEFQTWLMTADGQAYVNWAQTEKGGPTNPANIDAWLKKIGGVGRRQAPSFVRETVKAVHKRNQVNAMSTTQNAFNPWSTPAWRGRPNGAPVIPSFLTKDARMTRDVTSIDVSPYTVHGVRPIDPAGGRVNDFSRYKSDTNKVFVNLTGHASESAPVKYMRNDYPKPIQVSRDMIRVHTRMQTAR